MYYLGTNIWIAEKNHTTVYSPVLRIPAFRLVEDSLALLLPDVVVDDVAAVPSGLVVVADGGRLRRPRIRCLLLGLQLLPLEVRGGHGGAEKEGEEGGGDLHGVAGRINVVVGVRRKISQSFTCSGVFIDGTRQVLFSGGLAVFGCAKQKLLLLVQIK